MNTELAREQMVEQQVRTWTVVDEDVLRVFAEVQRDRYVPEEFLHCAYADAEIPIGKDQCMLRPSLDGRILQAVDIHPGESVLDIGTGTGYLAACISRLAGAVTSIDLYPSFIEKARERLDDDGVDNVTLMQLDASAQLPEDDYDVVIITASVPESDDRFANLLRPGGRLFVVIGESPSMTATLFIRGENGELEANELFETDIPPLVRAGERQRFTF